MAFENPTIELFKEYFSRDFPYGTDPATSVTDTDIAKAFQITNMKLNPSLFSNQTDYTLGYLYLSAHYLVTNLQASSQGLGGGGTASWLENSKSVGSVSQSFSIPQTILDNPMFAMYTRTAYGMRYLEFVYPRLIGITFNAFGRTQP
jgi:hypothetical protein